MADEVSKNSAISSVNNQENHSVSQSATVVSSTPTDTSILMETSHEQQDQQMNVVDDATLQAVISSMTESEMSAFLEELNKTGKAYLPTIGQTIGLLNVTNPSDGSSAIVTSMNIQSARSQPSADSALQELKTFIQQSPVDMLPLTMDHRLGTESVHNKSDVQKAITMSRQTRTANTYGGTPVISGGTRPGTAVKSTVSSNSATTMRRSMHQSVTHDDRLFFGRPSGTMPNTIESGQYHHRTGLISTGTIGQHRRVTSSHSIEQNQRRPISWFQSRSRRHSSGDDIDSDLDSSPPSYSIGSNDILGPTRRSARVPKPKHDADFVTFPLLDRDEHGNPITTTPFSMPLNRAEDDEDDIPYRLMDYPRPIQSSATISSSSSAQINSGSNTLTRKSRTVADLRSTNTITKKQARWPDDELYHVKAFVPLIMPQQITNPSIMKNKTTMCKPIVREREIEAKPTRFTIATQTEMEYMIPDVPLLSIPVPIYLPSPTPSYRLFKPRAVPIPVPVFVPILIPVPKTAYKSISHYLQRQRDLLPDDPFQAALILHAESLVRAENQTRTVNHSSETDTTMMMMDTSRDDSYRVTSNAIQNLPILDLEAHYIDPLNSNDPEVKKLVRMLPDADYRLKWTYGVQAFQHWCTQRTQITLVSSMEETTMTHNYQIKSDLLTYTSGDELQQILEIFIREVRRPNGKAYLPESIFYLCLGIQFYLTMNNIYMELFNPRYSEFNTTLNKILLDYRPRLLPGSNIHVSLVDEELFYDAQQFGTQTPWSLLNTLLYINSKYFNLKTVEAHAAISFANFGKYSQWVRLASGAPQGQQMNYLRFYAHNPDLKLLANAPIVYEITERLNEPVRCPVKYFDTYLSKCPDSIRNAADVFYLNPTEQQTSESSLWFSTEPLPPSIIELVLNRLKLLPGFYTQTKPVEIGASSTISNSCLPAANPSAGNIH